MIDEKISIRTNRIINLFLCTLLLVLIRIWYLSVVQYDEHFEQSHKPQRRTVIEPVERGTIRDRFNEPLALNKIQYNIAICYADIRQIPSIQWQKDAEDKPQKISARRQYIEQLAAFLGKELSLDPLAIEDIIHGKASLFPHTPFVIKENIGEELYHRLKLFEKDWLGLQTQAVAKRHYPRGKCGCDVIGYLGAINNQEYIKIAQEIKELKTYLNEREEGKLVFLPKGFQSPLEVRTKLRLLEERAYTINDLVGKSGVEAYFDQALRGSFGKKILEVDTKGNAIRELPGSKPPVGGERLVLSLSAELQEAAEELLAEYEYFQEKRDASKSKERRHPWMRGSSIVAMLPQTGEILALASYPRFNPDDFVQSKKNRSSILKWLEGEGHIAEIWDGVCPLERELFSAEKKCFYDEKRPFTWKLYLDTILPKESPIRSSLDSVATIGNALTLLEHFEEVEAISNEKDKWLFLDLLRLLIKKEDFTPSLTRQIGQQKLGDFYAFCQIVNRHRGQVKDQVKQLFHNLDFAKWRSQNFKEFLKQKRADEKLKKRYARPYTEYLQQEEKEQFQKFWEAQKLAMLYTFVMGQPLGSNPELDPYFATLITLRSDDADLNSLRSLLLQLEPRERLHYLKTLRPFAELSRPLLGKYPTLRSENGLQLEKHLASAFYPCNGFGYGRSQAFRQATPLGSVFKLIPAYVALNERYDLNLSDLNPVTLTDESNVPSGNNRIVGHFESGEPIHRFYKGGLLPRSPSNYGKVNLLTAIERSSNIYFSILAGDYLQDPFSLTHHASQMGFGEKTGIDLPGEYAGILPSDIAQRNKTGLYALAIGQHSLVVTPLQTATLFSAIANGGNLLKPQIVKMSAGKTLKREGKNLFIRDDFPYKSTLSLLGFSFPLFTQTLPGDAESFVSYRGPQIRSTIPFPEAVRSYMLEGMHLVTTGPRGSARPSSIKPLYQDPRAYAAYQTLYPQMIGKTGTAEILYKQTIDAQTPAQMEKHVWFAGISFKDKSLQEPELVVVVYLRFGEWGRDGAPLAARIVQKWREICAKHQVNP